MDSPLSINFKIGKSKACANNQTLRKINVILINNEQNDEKTSKADELSEIFLTNFGSFYSVFLAGSFNKKPGELPAGKRKANG